MTTAFTVLLCICIEACIFFTNQSPIYHIFPLTLLLLKLSNSIFKFKNKIYLIDYSCLSPPKTLRAPKSTIIEHLHLNGAHTKESISFMSKVITSSGQGETTFLPPALLHIPPKSDYNEFINESHLNLFPIFQNLLSKANLSPKDIDILVVNCSGFYPAPSLSSILINHFDMRHDVKNYNISGMGCNGGSIAIDLASNLLKVGMRYAVVVSTEVLSPMFYAGQDRSKLLLNCTFKMGSSAVLLANHKGLMHIDKIVARPKYELLHLVRTTGAFDDLAHNVSRLEDDSKGKVGFTVRRDILHVVREVVRCNTVALGRKMLPVDEMVRYFTWWLNTKLKTEKNGVFELFRCMLGTNVHHSKTFVPNFGKVVQHYCLPLIGKPVIEGIGSGLGLGKKDLEAAYMTFHAFGNQSSASWWYQLGYLEAKGRVKKGDKVWQIAFGSGCKCNSVVWKCIESVKQGGEDGAWGKLIGGYPIDIYEDGK